MEPATYGTLYGGSFREGGALICYARIGKSDQMQQSNYPSAYSAISSMSEGLRRCCVFLSDMFSSYLLASFSGSPI